jgi:hypothetical protein
LYECTAMFKNFQTEVIETNIQVYKRERTVWLPPSLRRRHNAGRTAASHQGR